MKKSSAIIFILTLAFITLTSSLRYREEYKIRTVVIDAGHGGHDSGCLGASVKEKNIALAIALRLGKLIEDNNPDVKVIYTRKTDVFIPLHERAEIANRAKADLFICVHLNSGGKAAYGVETYVMGNHKSEDNLLVAKRENSAILLEDDYKKQYDGFDPNSPEANIIFTLFQSQFQHQSLLFASKIQDHSTDYGGRYNRGVKQAGFLVLYRTTMPSVLIECGFLTHDSEEKFLSTDKGQGVMASSIYRAFKEYKLDMESPGDIPTKSSASKIPIPVKTPVIEKGPEPIVKTPDTVVQQIEEVEFAPKVVKEPEPKPVSLAVAEPVTPFISVQIGASLHPEMDNKKFLSRKDVKAVKCSDGYTRYVVGQFFSSTAAANKLKEVKASGIKDAFLVGINGNQRLSVKEAEELLKRP